jgi:hypothetical protein
MICIFPMLCLPYPYYILVSCLTVPLQWPLFPVLPKGNPSPNAPLSLDLHSHPTPMAKNVMFFSFAEVICGGNRQQRIARTKKYKKQAVTQSRRADGGEQTQTSSQNDDSMFPYTFDKGRRPSDVQVNSP